MKDTVQAHGTTPAGDATMPEQASATGEVIKNATTIANGLKLFHDAGDRPPVGRIVAETCVTLDATRFDGTWISLAADLPGDQARQIRAGMELVVRLNAEATPPVPTFIRAHFSNEEGREALHDLIVVATGKRIIRFNLDGLRIPVDLATSAYVDVIFSQPAGTRLSVQKIDLQVEEQ